MHKDLEVLLGTTNNEIFEEQAKFWPGVEVFRKCAWRCQCGKPDCFRNCVQGYGEDFPDHETYARYLEEIGTAGIDSMEELMAYTADFAKRMRTGEKRLVH